jgi:hypothetical protein
MKCSCKCYHEAVKYCNTCCKVHCESCGMTWEVPYPQYVNVPSVWDPYKITSLVYPNITFTCSEVPK